MRQLMEFPLCEQTVTIYRLAGGERLRIVLENCFYRWEDVLEEGDAPYLERRFLLVIPGGFAVQPGDRIFPGEGPEQVDWNRFVPAAVEGLGRVGYVKQYPTHTEAGYKQRY